MSQTIVLIPARLQATRLPGKPLALIGKEPMIIHVWRRALEADLGPVFVATEASAIADVIIAAGGKAIMTREDHPSGSDRVFEALTKIDPDGTCDAVINLQGDLPSLDPRLIRDCANTLKGDADISTLAAEIITPSDALDPNIVKVIGSSLSKNVLRAHYFTRASAPFGPGPLYHHIGIYGYRREALARFVSLPPSPLELRERLEQLRAIENGMRIHVGIVDTIPLGVDTPADLQKARYLLAPGYTSPTLSDEAPL